jgi:hypothetical protein
MEAIRFIHETYEEISEITLAGLLAVIVWFIISQGSVTSNIYTLGAISLTVGRVTEEVGEQMRYKMDVPPPTNVHSPIYS